MLGADATHDLALGITDSILRFNIRSFMCAPLWNREEVIGVLYVDSPRSKRFVAEDLDIFAALANYAGMMWLAWRIQKTLHESGLYRHGAWQVWVGALLLNPCALGWWIPVSVMLRAHKIRSALRARWPHAAGE